MCRHPALFLVCESDLSDPLSQNALWHCPSCGESGTEFSGDSSMDMALAEAEMLGRSLS